jgi:glucan phosphoethanolaminetransferase (alkaline phosphatase superfamily)
VAKYLKTAVNNYSCKDLKAVRDDLQGLEISHNELQNLTNLPVNEDLLIITNILLKFGKTYIDKIKGSEGATVIFIGFSTFVFTYILFDLVLKVFVSWVTIPSWLFLLFLGLWVGGLTQSILYLLWKSRTKLVKKNMNNSLRILLSEVNRYNAIIKAIDINDQIEEAGNPEVVIKQRDSVIEALKLTKTDLVRALKTERILRENKNFILSNTELFANNLATLTAMQVHEQATEHGRLLNEALQIALDVQHEMKKLQSQH